jgi:hypothetical protein
MGRRYIFGGPSNAVGEQIPLVEAEARVFGAVIVNDWSARDHQVGEHLASPASVVISALLAGSTEDSVNFSTCQMEGPLRNKKTKCREGNSGRREAQQGSPGETRG